jgi:hypothetical protein
MPLGVDYIAGKQAIDKLSLLLSRIPHGEREAIADDIIELVEKLEEKYKEEVEDKFKK